MPETVGFVSPPYDLVGPFRGECGLCGGPDARHRVFEAVAGCVLGGDTVEEVADDYGLPEKAVRAIVAWARDHPEEDV